MAEKLIYCTVCGAHNEPSLSRCSACGAKLPGTGAVDPLAENQNNEDDFNWKWVGVALGIYAIMQAGLLVLLPRVMPNYDPQGFPGVLIVAGIWFIGAVLVGVSSRVQAVFEPVLAAIIAAAPTVAYMMSIADVHRMSLMAHVVGAAMGIMISLLGSVLGNRLRA
ncbi:MAG: zinc finger Ran-binding domain-containing protein [Polyangiales bacterium]